MEQLINEILIATTMFLSTEQQRQLKNVISAKLIDYRIEKEERLPSININDTWSMIQYYCECLKIDGKSAETIKQYRLGLNKFFLKVGFNYKEVDKRVARAYVYHLETQNYKATTVNDHIKTLSAFYAWLNKEEYITFNNPFSYVTKLKVNPTKRMPATLDMEKIYDVCQTRREKVLIALCRSTGIRACELARINIKEDLDLINKTLKIHGKGNKDRVVPISDNAKIQIEKYIEEREQKGIFEDYLFVSSIGKHQPLNKRALQKIMCNLSDRCGSKVEIHMIRRWFATTMVQKGIPASYLQAILGHSSFDTTMKHYINYNSETTVNECRKYMNY